MKAIQCKDIFLLIEPHFISKLISNNEIDYGKLISNISTLDAPEVGRYNHRDKNIEKNCKD